MEEWIVHLERRRRQDFHVSVTFCEHSGATKTTGYLNSKSEYCDRTKAFYYKNDHHIVESISLFTFSYLVTVFSLEEHRFKSVPPKYFWSEVGATALCCHCCGLHHALKYDHHLQLRVILQGLSVNLVERRLVVNLVDNRHRWDQEDSVSACVETHVDVCIVQWKEFTLLRNPRLKKMERKYQWKAKCFTD